MIAESPDAAAERTRKQRLSEELDRLHRHRAGAHVHIPVASDAQERTMQNLAAGVKLESGRLTIEFEGALQLLAKLYELGQAAANDYESFRAAADGST